MHRFYFPVFSFTTAARLPGRLTFLFIASVAVAVCPAVEPEAPWSVVFADSFNAGLENWVVEQTPDGTTQIIDGELDIDGGGTTVWLRRRLEGPTIIEFDARLIQQSGSNDHVRDLNTFWMATAPGDPSDLFNGTTSNRESRGGVFARYHDLRTYYVGCGGNRNTTTRFRRYPGDGSRPLLPAHDLRDRRFLLEPERIYRVRVVADGHRIQWWRDDECIFDFHDPDPLTAGWFGFRTVSNHLRLDHVRVLQRRPVAVEQTWLRRAFKVTPQRVLTARILQPAPSASPSGSSPALVLFHGGGWRRGTADQFDDQAPYLANRGVVVIQPEYRLTERDGSTPFEAVADARSALRWVRAHASELGVDPTRLAAGGGSAGGHLAAACALDLPHLDDPADDRAISCRPEALVLFNPVFDNGPAGYGYAWFGERYHEISPLHNITPGLPPTLILMGDRDVNLPVATGEAYRDRMQSAGNECELIVYPGYGHGFFNRAKGGEEIHVRARQAMIDFLVAHGY